MRSDSPSLNPALKSFWLQPARYRVLYGGRDSSKSWDAAGFAIFLAQHCKIKVLCTRQFQNRIEDSVYTLLKIQIARFGLRDRFEVLNNKITCKTTGSEFVFYGLWRSIDEVKSMEGIDIHWSEEAHLLTEEQFDVLDPTIRKEGSQHWIVFNPRLISDFTYKRFVTNPLPGTVKRKINYDENPFLSATSRRLIEAMQAEDPDKFRHVYLGEPLMDDEQAVIRRSWLMAAIDAHKALNIQITGDRRIGFDVADAGEDWCAMVEGYGPLATWSDLWKGQEDELLKSCSKVWTSARDRGARVVYDAIGVGAGVGSKFNELNAGQAAAVQHEKFFAGGAVVKPDAFYDPVSKVRNKDFFANIKAQAWWGVADRLKNTFNSVRHGQKFADDEMIFIDSSMPNLDKLIDELSTPKRDYDNAGRVKVESKKDLEKREIASPNMADAFVMAFLPGEMKRRSFFG